jgi:signal transduction histidine kinase
MPAKPPWVPTHHHHEPPWRRGWGHKPRFLFFRFAGLFGFMALLVISGMAILAFLMTRFFGGDGSTALLVWLGGCSLALAFPLLAVGLAIRAFRGIATPLAEIMTAADAVSAGDLRVRVPERGPGEFSRLARSFNRMTEELARTDQLRRNLTADVAHELRTPLHIIQGNLEGILDGVYEATPEHIAATLEETQLLKRLVDDLRTLSLAEAGQLRLRQESVNVVELLGDVATSFSGQIEAAGLNLTVLLAGRPLAAAAPPLMLLADVGRLNQVLGNLMINAIRHTPAGGRISLEASPTAQGVRLRVSDSGEGIPAEALPYIFDRFWRGDRARSHAGGAGAGLGLAIARQLVQAHGGEIYAVSEPGQGTTFTIELPQPRPG